jgi:hypothetical protein
MKNKITVCVKWVVVAACLAVVVAVAVFVPRQTTEPTPSEQAGTKDVQLAGSNNDVEIADSNNSDDTSDDARLQEKIRELQAGDSIGWIVIENKIYIQAVSDIDYTESNEDSYLGRASSFSESHQDEDTYLGRASSFTGYYQDEDACDGDVYASYANSNIIYIKLDNGGKVTLEEMTDESPEATAIDVCPAIMVNGEVYFDTNHKSTATGRCGIMDGQITSECSSSEIPSINNQSNFGTGYGYQYGGRKGTIEVLLDDGEWYVFAKEDVKANY